VKKIEKFDIFWGNFPNPNHKWLNRPDPSHKKMTRPDTGQNFRPRPITTWLGIHLRIELSVVQSQAPIFDPVLVKKPITNAPYPSQKRGM